MTDLKSDAQEIIRLSIASVMPDRAVKKALENRNFGNGKLLLISAGKAAWQMAKTAYDCLGGRVDGGAIITKYGHSRGQIGDLAIYEGGHPVPDGNSVRGTRAATRLVKGLNGNDTVIFLLSGGGSALFELPLVPLEDLKKLTVELLERGADIGEINTVRKRLSAVKGGRFAQLCSPARVLSVILSDVPAGCAYNVASGPTYEDLSTCADALSVAEKYRISCTDEVRRLLNTETPRGIRNVENIVTGSVGELVKNAALYAEGLGYSPVVLSDSLCCEARDAGSFLASEAGLRQDAVRSVALIAGGETVVHVKGKGLGGRNQEITLSGAIGIAGMRDTALFSIGSDGTDGPTDAAGGYADGNTVGGKISLREALEGLADNDSYNVLKKAGGLIITGPTGTNVNDLSVVLIRR